MTRMPYAEALAQAGVMDALAAFDPHVAGTPPLGIDLPSSDIDILCEAPDLAAFTAHLRHSFGAMSQFMLLERRDLDAVIARFTGHGWPFEIFGQAIPVAPQHGWRHFEVERRLLALGGDALREQVMAWRRSGLKTEPAFAAALKLPGDPYAAMLDLGKRDDATLLALIRSRE